MIEISRDTVRKVYETGRRRVQTFSKVSQAILMGIYQDDREGSSDLKTRAIASLSKSHTGMRITPEMYNGTIAAVDSCVRNILANTKEQQTDLYDLLMSRVSNSVTRLGVVEGSNVQ